MPETLRREAQTGAAAMSGDENELNRLPIDHPSSYGGMMQENAALHAEVARLTAEVDRKDNAWRDAERHIKLLTERLAAAERLVEASVEFVIHPVVVRNLPGQYWSVMDVSKKIGERHVGTFDTRQQAFVAAGWLPQDEAKG